ncbi:unnamed protein product [Cyprideis torosa]|uniref:Uncharacterized protein n=1 Tax=Cyprideis torosa TaxID=163714 RepID=A0A7R8WDR8_9CRUS|nr:unnamed protein product [Cyprideis torosa]CAG0888657.1 unnamed protein product [Cyprideis torosa]
MEADGTTQTATSLADLFDIDDLKPGTLVLQTRDEDAATEQGFLCSLYSEVKNRDERRKKLYRVKRTNLEVFRILQGRVLVKQNLICEMKLDENPVTSASEITAEQNTNESAS